MVMENIGATTIWKVRDKEFELVLSMLTSYASLGNLYKDIMMRISFSWLEEPGKGMILALYGKASRYYEKLKSFVRINPDSDEPFCICDRKIVRTKNRSKACRIYDEIADKVVGKIIWDPHGEMNQDAVDVA